MYSLVAFFISKIKYFFTEDITSGTDARDT